MVGKATRKVNIIATIMLIAMGLQCFPIPVLGSNFGAQLTKRDQFIKKANTKVNQSLNKQLDLITKVTKGGFSFLEKQTGLNEQNKLYKTTKNRTLEKTGFKLGVAEGTKDFSMGAFSFLATPDKLPTRVRAMGGAVKNAVSSTVSNPRAVASSLSSSFYGWLTRKEADPLKRGRVAGKAVGFEGAFFVAGGTAVKAAVKATNKASKVAGIATKTPKTASTTTSQIARITPKITASGVKINSKAKILTEKAWHSVTRGFNNIKVGGTSKQMEFVSFYNKVGKPTVPTAKVSPAKISKKGKFTIEDLDKAIITNSRLPGRKDVVELVAKEIGAKLTGVNVRIMKKSNNGRLASAETDILTGKQKLCIYPGSFKNPCFLAESIGHEVTHFFQHKTHEEKLLRAIIYDNRAERVALNVAFENAAYTTDWQWGEYLLTKSKMREALRTGQMEEYKRLKKIIGE